MTKKLKAFLEREKLGDGETKEGTNKWNNEGSEMLL